MKENFKLFLIMMKIGLFTFGGGYAMIPLIENEFVTKRSYMTHDEFMNMVAIAESTPGPIAINSATYIGYRMGKFWGALLATLGVILPSFVIISLISLVINQFLEIELVAAAFKGIQACVVFLILSAGIKMLKKLEKNIFNYIVFAITIILVVCFSIFSISFSSIFYIIIAGVLSLAINMVIKLRNRDKEEKQ